MGNAVWAGPVSGQMITLRQPDGALVQAGAWGDEYYQELESTDGYALVRDPASLAFCYARLAAGEGELLSTGVWVGKGDPARLGLVKHLKITSAARVAKVRAAREAAAEREATMRAQAAQKLGKPQPEPKPLITLRDIMGAAQPYSATQAQMAIRDRLTRSQAGRSANPDRLKPELHTGGAAGSGAKPLQTIAPTTIRGICLLIDFPDDPANVTPAQVERFCNQVGYTDSTMTHDGNKCSVHDYFYDISNGLIHYTNYVAPAFYRAPYPKSYYEDPTDYYFIKTQILVASALGSLTSLGLDWSQFDSNHDGYIDAINVFYAGDCTGGPDSPLWPKSTPIDMQIGGLRTSKFQVMPIFSDLGLTLGYFCHENGHQIFGWPDLYDTSYNSQGVGGFCLMGDGCLADNMHNPVEPCAYLKAISGLATVYSLTQPAAGVSVQSGTNTFYAWHHPTRANEYFMIENINQRGRNAAQPGSGLAVWHVDTTGNNRRYQMTPESHYLVSLEQADGRFDLENGSSAGDAGDLFRAAGASAFTDWTLPGAHWWDGSPSGLGLSRISAPGTVMTFSVGEPFSLQAAPIAPYHLKGFKGCAVQGATQYTLTNRGTANLDWTAVKTNAPWLTLSKSSGRLAPNTSETITATIAAAGTLSASTRGAVQFLDFAVHDGPSRDIFLDLDPVVLRWDPVASPQMTSQSFAVRLVALDARGSTLTQYAGPATLGAVQTSPNGSFPVTPAATGAFTSGVWRGSLTLGQELAGARLRALDATGNSGDSNPFDVRLPLWISPASGFDSGGPAGGLFVPAAADYTLTNLGRTPLNWSAAKTAAWLTLSKTAGTLAPGTSCTVHAALAQSALDLTTGTYRDTLTFTDLVRGAAQTRPASLTVRPLSGFKFSPIASPQTVNGPFAVRLAAVDSQGTTATRYTGAATLTSVDTMSAGNQLEQWSHPLNTYYDMSRTEVIYLASELGEAGPLTALWLNVHAAPGVPLYNFTIRMKHTALAAQPASGAVWDSDGWTTVTRGNFTVSQTGWTRFDFTQSFAYNGIDNLMIDFSCSNPGRSYSSGLVFGFSASSNRVLSYDWIRYGTLSEPTAWSGSDPMPTVSKEVPNIRLSRSVALTPLATGGFVAGAWAGQVAALDEATSLVLQARDDASGLAGASNGFRVSPPFVRRVSSPHPDGVFSVGEAIDLDVAFSGKIRYGGTPTLQLETGDIDRTVNCTGLVTSDTLRFRYVVGAGEMTPRLDVLSAGALGLNGGWVRAAAGGTHNALLPLPAPGMPGSLSAVKAICIDTTPPTVLLSSAAPDPTNRSPIPVRVCFSKPVSGFTAAGLTVSNAAVTGFGGSGTTYTLGLVPKGQGLVSVSVPAGAARDSGGVGNAASDPLERRYDSLPPAYSIAAFPALAGPGAEVQFYLIPSETVTSTPTLTVNSHPAVLQGHNELGYAFSYRVQDVNFEGPALVAVTSADLLGNKGATTNTTALRLDTLGPRPTVTGPPSPVSASPITFTITFHETVTGFSGSGIAISGGVPGTLASRGDNKTFDLPVIPTGRGDVTCLVPAGAARDALGNLSSASETAVVRYDNDPDAARLLRYLLGAGGEDTAGLNLNGDQGVNVADLVWLLSHEAPLAPASPSPAPGATNISVGTALDWSDCPRTRFFRVFLWPAARSRPSAPAFTGLSLSTAVPPQPLAFGTKYNWQVVAAGDSGVTTGPLWSFTTAGNPVQVAAPNGGQVWQLGKTAQVHWRLNTTLAGTQVRIELWRAGAPAAVLGQFSAATGDATSNVSVPATLPPAKDYRVRVISTKLEQTLTPVPWDESDGTIELKP